jgi:hypothetical protein
VEPEAGLGYTTVDVPAGTVGCEVGIAAQVQLVPSELTFVGYSPGGHEGPVTDGFPIDGSVRDPMVGALGVSHEP